MTRPSLFVLIATLCAGPALAAEDAVLLRLDAKVCRQLARHLPEPNVAYQPGVDARGRPVVPADVAAEPLALPEPRLVEIAVDTFKRLGIPPEGRANYRGQAIVGLVEVAPDGLVRLNGRPLPGEGERALAAACARARGAGP